jgi:DNA-binding MarR family transcriptional regulator
MTTTRKTLRLHTSEAARLLIKPNSQRFLRPFLGCECSAKAAADTLGVSLSLMAYWLKRFEAQGLLEHVRSEPRAGRPVKVYRSTADAFVAPFELLPPATLAEFFGTFGTAEQTRFSQALGRVSEEMAARDWGVRLSRRDDGKVSIDAVPNSYQAEIETDFLASELPAAWQSFSTIRLSFEEAKGLQRELAELWERYMSRDEGQVYLLQLGLVQDKLVKPIR